MFFAYEGQDQITKWFAEAFKRLSNSANVSENLNTTPETMREKVNSLMTNAVKKKS